MLIQTVLACGLEELILTCSLILAALCNVVKSDYQKKGQHLDMEQNQALPAVQNHPQHSGSTSQIHLRLSCHDVYVCIHGFNFL